MTHSTDRDHEPYHAASSTPSLLTELQLFGHRPFQGEPDTRPLPEPQQVGIALANIFDALVATFTDTRLEPDLEDLLWSTVNLFHRAGDRIERELDGNEQAQRRSQKEQDGSEVRSVELSSAPATRICAPSGFARAMTRSAMPPCCWRGSAYSAPAATGRISSSPRSWAASAYGAAAKSSVRRAAKFALDALRPLSSRLSDAARSP